MTESLMRAIAPLTLPDVTPSTETGALPLFRLVKPSDLMVDAAYQRNLTPKSVALIERIVREWNFRAFKPPVVVEVENTLHVIDGQHTAIAAASHPGIELIPVMVVSAAGTEDRADSFVRHNRDRIAVTPADLHFALVAAKDDDAVTIEQVCARAGVTILRQPPSQGRYKVGDTHAIATIRTLVNRRYALGARRVLDVLIKAQRAPVASNDIKAVDHLFYDPAYANDIGEDDIVAVFLNDFELETKARRFAAEHRLPFWRALASTIFMSRKRRRGSDTRQENAA